VELGVHRGEGVPLHPKSTEEFGKRLKKSFGFLGGAMVSRLVGREKTHEIDEQNGQMRRQYVGKMK
jgi:hypothetical protein